MSLIKNLNSLATTPARKAVLEIVEAGLTAIQPEKVLAQWQIPDGNYERIFLVGFGKGSAEISRSVVSKIENSGQKNKFVHGWIIDVEISPQLTAFTKLTCTTGTHPLPSETNVVATRQALIQLTQLNKLTSSDLVIVVVCGGGSALFTDPTIPVEELIEKNRELLKSGKNISKMNAERKKWDRVKGGGLAERLLPAKVVGLIFSDVPGNDLATIASGPTVGGTAENILMLSNMTALLAMKKNAEELGYTAEIYSDRLQGEARNVGAALINKTLSELPNQGVLLAGGETTVTARGNGKGGRNQELVLGVLSSLTMDKMDNITICSVDTDGWDNGPVTGAIGDKMKLDPTEFLMNNNSFDYFQKTGDFVETGRLPSNVADLMVVLKI